MTTFRYGLAWLVVLVLLPLLLLLTLTVGVTALEPNKLLHLSSGVFTYVWLLAALVMSSRPTWLHLKSAVLAQFALLGAALPLAFGHSSANTLTGLSELTGHLAFLMLLSVGMYVALYLLTSRFFVNKEVRFLGSTWLKHIIAVLCGLVFIHVQFIDSLRQNIMFMLLFYLLTLAAFVPYLTAKPVSQTTPSPSGEVSSGNL